MFIFGLPRSRTAWFSAFMSQSGIKFYHEAIDGCNTLAEYENKISGCGDCTTGLCLLGSTGITSNAKIVIIKKNKKELERCVSWCDDSYDMNSKALVDEWYSQLMSFDGLVVNQSEIDDNLKSIWEYLVDIPWDDKYKDIAKLNIQVKSICINEEAAKNLHESIQ